jgi:hypothetical protein
MVVPFKGWTGLLNDPNVTQGYAIADGTGSSPLWSTKTGDQMVRDVNSVLTSVYTTSLTIETANTVLMDPAHFTQMANTRLPNTTMNALEWLRQYNAYTALTQQPITIMAARGLETAGLGGTSRIMAYRRDPQIVKFHLPMPHRFLPVWQTAPIVYDVPGIFPYPVALKSAVRGPVAILIASRYGVSHEAS